MQEQAHSVQRAGNFAGEPQLRRSREETVYEMEHLCGFTLEEPPACAVMRAYLEGGDV